MLRLDSLRWPFATRHEEPTPAVADWQESAERRTWGFPDARRAEFREIGCNQRWPFFPHDVFYLPKAGPDALRLAGWMLGLRDADCLWQIGLHARDAALDGIPEELFFDDDIVWHQQQLGQPGHIAYACIAVRGQDVYGLNYVADVVQRISRRRELKTRIESRFRGWPILLLNSMIAFAHMHGKRRVYSPTADLVLKYTDPERAVDRALFDRVYDRAVARQFRVRRAGQWWVLDLAENRARIVLPEQRTQTISNRRTICLGHDLERGWGHRASHPEFGARAESASRAALPDILTVERQLGVSTTCNVVGSFLEEVRADLTRAGHALAFHSFDHDRAAPQLERCRALDYRIAGYRAPQSHITRELSDRNLCLHNFTWLAAASSVLGTTVPRIGNRVIKIPIAFDDYALFTGELTYEAWEQRALGLLEQGSFVAFCLHDCYAEFWLPHYASFLERVRRAGRLATIDQVATELILAAAR